MIDNIVCTNKFKKSVQKLIAKNKIYGKELLETIEHLRQNNYTTYKDLKRHKLSGKLAGYYDIHFSNTDNNLILVYTFRSDGSLFILELQNTVNHKQLKHEIPTKNFVDYDEDEIFGTIKESINPIDKKRLKNLYTELQTKCYNLESTDYEDGYCDAIYDMINVFNLQKYFE